MRKSIVSLVVALLAIPMLSATSSASLVLKYPDISSEGSISFDSSTGLLSSSQTPLTITYDGVNFNHFVSGSLTFTAQLSSYSSNGTTVTGYFGNSSAYPDFSLTAFDGTENYWIYGEFDTLKVEGLIGNTLGTAESLINITSISPNLEPFFDGRAGMLSLYFNISPIFSANTFLNNFSGAAKTDVASVPEPGTMLLLGVGLVGLACVGRKRARR